MVPLRANVRGAWSGRWLGPRLWCSRCRVVLAVTVNESRSQLSVGGRSDHGASDENRDLSARCEQCDTRLSQRDGQNKNSFIPKALVRAGPRGPRSGPSRVSLALGSPRSLAPRGPDGYFLSRRYRRSRPPRIRAAPPHRPTRETRGALDRSRGSSISGRLRAPYTRTGYRLAYSLPCQALTRPHSETTLDNDPTYQIRGCNSLICVSPLASLGLAGL